MRNAFASEITTLAAEQPELMLLSGDIGNRLFDKFKAQFPERFMNCGVAEANMMSMAAGMALCGLRPVTYTIAPFTTTRCFEQIRVDVCYHRAPVVIVGVGAGLSYAANGATHHSCEDIAILRMLPDMTVICPGDPTEVRLALRAALAHSGPVYLRLGKKGEPQVHADQPRFTIGRVIPLLEGSDVSIASTGTMLPLALDAARLLNGRGVSVEVVSCHTVKPLDEEYLRRAFERVALVVSLEEHSRLGGLGGAIAEWVADQPRTRARLLRIGTADEFLHEAGEQDHARRHFGLTPRHVADQVLNGLNTLAASSSAAGSDQARS